jgi:hypothetical protein
MSEAKSGNDLSVESRMSLRLCGLLVLLRSSFQFVSLTTPEAPSQSRFQNPAFNLKLTF